MTELIDEYIELKQTTKVATERLERLRKEIIDESISENEDYFIGTNKNISVIEKTVIEYDVEKLSELLEERDLLGLANALIITKSTINKKELEKLIKLGVLTPVDMINLVKSQRTEYALKIDEKY